MKVVITLAALGAMLVGTVACSSAPKQEEAAPVAAASVSDTSAPVEEAPAPQKDMSLGAGSSGRGH